MKLFVDMVELVDVRLKMDMLFYNLMIKEMQKMHSKKCKIIRFVAQE